MAVRAKVARNTAAIVNRQTAHTPFYLLSVDLEDVRALLPDGARYRDRVPETASRFLAFFREHKLRVTFFTVGLVAEQHPDLINTIRAEGHELACHTARHTPVDRLTPQEFRSDLVRNREALLAAGADEVVGFRAPFFSVTEKTAWIYEILAELGFCYSSSVLPARSPQYGWPGFGQQPRYRSGILELPMTLFPTPFPRFPIGGGVYMRVLPTPILVFGYRTLYQRGQTITGYVHPHDIDPDQERFMFPGIGESRLYNFLMYWGRRGTLSKLERLLRLGFQVTTYANYTVADTARRTANGGGELAGVHEVAGQATHANGRRSADAESPIAPG
jgi:polysaccharide deacetylase family protein (PEP-CTERM system associated)